MSELEALARLRGGVAEVRARVAELEGEDRRAARSLARARGPWEDYLRAVEAGERDPDPDEEARLRAEVERVGATMSIEAVHYNGQLRDVIARDPAVLARLEGARNRLERRESELATFLREHLGALLSELRGPAEEARAAYWQTADALAAADAQWRGLAARYDELATLAGRPELAAGLPGPPLSIEGQAWSDYAATRRRAPDAHLPVPPTHEED